MIAKPVPITEIKMIKSKQNTPIYTISKIMQDDDQIMILKSKNSRSE